MADTSQSGEIQSLLSLHSHSGHFGKWRWAIATILSIAIALYFIAPFSGNRGIAVSYKTAPVKRGDLTLTVTATGTLQPLNQVVVGSELSGTIASVEVDFNDEVKLEQVLARLDTTALNSRIAEGKASLQQAQAMVEEARATELEKRAALNRCKELAMKQLCSPNDLDTAEAAYARARATVSSARAQVAMAQAVLDGHETNLKKAIIRSPINGIVLNRKVEPGQTVAASLQTPELFTLAEDLTHMELKGPELYGTLTGTISIRREFMDSGLNLKGTVDPSQSFFEGSEGASVTVNVQGQSLGLGPLSFRIRGTLKNPRFDLI